MFSTCAVASTGFAQTFPRIPVIYAAAADAGQTTLIVQGRNFDQDAAVYLAGVALGGVDVNDAGTVVTATIAGTLPGSYQLRIANGRFLTQNAFFDVTLGAVGPQGPVGEQGPPGPDQSGAIAALTAQIDALASRVNAVEALLVHFSRNGNDVTIKANAINLQADTMVNVKAGLTLGLEAAADANLKGTTINVTATGITEIKGALVKIN
jgi:hypothetical protein